MHTAHAADSWRAYPANLELTGARAEANLVFQRVSNAEVGQQVTEGIEVRIADPAVAEYADGKVMAKADGQTELVAVIKRVSSR